MEFNESTYNLFDNFLSGNLSESDVAAFEKRLAENKLAENEFSFFNSAVNTIKMSGNNLLKKQLSEIASGISSSAFEKYSPSFKPKNFFQKFWWAIAASAVILTVTIWFIFHEKKNLPEINNREILKADTFQTIKNQPIIFDTILKKDTVKKIAPKASGGKKPAKPQPKNNSGSIHSPSDKQQRDTIIFNETYK